MSPSPTAWMPAPVNPNMSPSPTAWMPVLVKDLCNPDVVATIAKRKDYSPRLSISPEPEDPWPEGYETPGPDPPEVIAERNETEAKEAYNTLIQMGGRPTGSIRPIPPWERYVDLGDLCYRYAEKEETLFYSQWHGTKPDSAASSTEAGYIAGHWINERKRCSEELRRWQGFLSAQQWRREHCPEFLREEDIERQRYPHDPHLTASLKKWKDWKEYRTYFQRGIDRCNERIEGARRSVEAIQRKDPELVLNKGKLRGYYDSDWLDFIESQREWVAAEEKLLKWVKQQLPAILSECATLLMGVLTSLCEMELRSELEAKGVFNTLVETGGRPTRPIRPVTKRQEHDYTDEHLHVLCHWEGECSQFEEELREWKKFLDYRQKKEADERTGVQLEGQQSTDITTQVELWKDFRAYRQLEVENAKQWVEFWQRQLEDFRDREDRCVRQGQTEVAYRLHSKAKDARSYVKEAQKQVRPAEVQLKWAEEQLSALITENAVSVTEVSIFDHLEDQAKLPKRASRSSQTALKNLRSNR
ncbi:MAG: hypothetical protein Q9217_006595, partial [Psora testacea]